MLRERQARRQSAFKAQVAAEDRSRLKPQIPHAFFVAFQTNVVGFELGPAGHESNAPVAILVEIFDDLLDPREIIDSQVAHVSTNGSAVEESHRDPSARQLVDQAQTDFGGHHGHSPDVMLHHSLGGVPRAAGVIIGIAEDRVITKLASTHFKTLDDVGKERVFNIGDDDSKGAAVAGSKVARMNVWEVAEALHGGEHQRVSAAAYLARLVQNIRDCGGRDARSLCYLSNG